MASISTEKLSGVVAGALLFRAGDSLVSAAGQFLIPGIDLSVRLTIVFPSMFGAVVAGLLGIAYLRPSRAEWVSVVAIVLLSLSTCLSLVGVITPFLRTFSSDDRVRNSMVGSQLGQLIVVAALLGLVIALARRGNEPPGQAPAAPPPSAG